jgi:hypothetical protein
LWIMIAAPQRRSAEGGTGQPSRRKLGAWLGEGCVRRRYVFAKEHE